MNRNEPVRTLRQTVAREAALRVYAEAHDRFSEAELIYRAENNLYRAEGAHEFALRAPRAYRAELDDPEPRQW